MIRLNITRLNKRLSMKPPSENDFSSLLIAKNTPIRQLSISTRTSKQSQFVKRLPTNPNQDSQHLTSRTVSIQDTQSQPLTEKKLSINNIPNKKKTSRRLVGLPTQPNLIIKPKFMDIKYETIELYQLHVIEPRILYKGQRDISLFQRIVIVGQTVNLNKQLIMKLRSECIVVLLTNNMSQIGEQFDCVIQPPKIPCNEVLSCRRNENQIFLSLNLLIHSLKQPEQFILIDEINTEENNYCIEDFKNKILYEGNCKMLHLFLHQNRQNSSKLYYTLCHLFKYDQQDLQQLNLKNILQECSENCLQISTQLQYFQQVSDIKNKMKQQLKKEQMYFISPEERAETLRNDVIEYVKSRTNTKIIGMYYLIGDTIMRNLQFFRNRQNDKYFREKKHQATLQLLSNTLQPIKHALIQQQQYAFYLL